MRSLWRSLFSVFLAFWIVFSNSLCALANTTTEQSIFYNNTRSIPTGFNISLSAVSLNKDTNLWNQSSFVNLVDNASSYFLAGPVILSGNTGDKLVGFTLHFSPNIDGGFYSQHVIDLSAVELRINTSNSMECFTLSSTAVPVYAYAEYDGFFDYQIYDGSAGYERWIYDNSFTLTKPIQINNTNFGQIYSDSSVGHDMFIKTPSISSADILNITAYKNKIAESIEFAKTEINDVEFVSIEDFPTENIRISNDMVTVYVLYSVDNTSFEPYASWMGDIDIPSTLDGCSCSFIVNPTKYNNNLTSVNVNSIEYLNDENYGLSFISNGFYSLKNSITSNLSNVVTNATENADRIIQNTTNKINEVKEGVTEVKDSVVETKNSILDLPNKIKEMLTGFFVPDGETINSKFSEFETLLSDRFGLIYQSADIIHDFAESFQTQAVMTADTGGIITMPEVTVSLAGTPFTFGGYEVDIIPDGFEVLQKMCRLAVSMVCTVVFINMLKSKLEWILK